MTAETNWPTVPLKRLTVSGFKNGTWGAEPGDAEIDVACVRAADFDRVRLRATGGRLPMRSLTRAEWRRNRLSECSIVLEKSGGGDQQPVGKAVLFDLPIDAVCSNFQASAEAREDCDARYVVYLLESLYETRAQMPFVKQTTGLQNLDTSAYLAVRVPRPERTRQAAISDYLDAETARIDELVAEKQRFIELLAERRAALVGHAVTQGLDSSVSTKDSGIEWAGQIPCDWSSGPILRFARLESGHTPSRQHPEWWVDCDVPWFTTSDIVQVRDGRKNFVSETTECVSLLGLANSSARVLPARTVMLSRTASVGFSAISAVPMATSQDFANWVCGERLLPEYLLYSLRAMKGEFRRLGYGSTHMTIYMPDIRRLAIALPPLEEQRAIAAYLDTETAAIDELTDATRQSIDLLKEYRTALISAAVTGQIDVSSMATPGEGA